MKRPIVDATPVASRHDSRFFYGWMIVSTSFLLALFTMGIQGSFGNFIKPMSAEFGWDRATATLPVAVATLMSGIFQPIVGRLVDHYGPRRVITVGGRVARGEYDVGGVDPEHLVSHRGVRSAVRSGHELCRGDSQ